MKQNNTDKNFDLSFMDKYFSRKKNILTVGDLINELKELDPRTELYISTDKPILKRINNVSLAKYDAMGMQDFGTRVIISIRED